MGNPQRAPASDYTATIWQREIDYLLTLQIQWVAWKSMPPINFLGKFWGFFSTWAFLSVIEVGSQVIPSPGTIFNSGFIRGIQIVHFDTRWRAHSDIIFGTYITLFLWRCVWHNQRQYSLVTWHNLTPMLPFIFYCHSPFWFAPPWR